MATKRKTPVRLYKDIDLDFKLNPVTHDIGLKTDVQAVKQSLKNLFMTQRGEKKFQPNYGSGIRALLFEPVDYLTGSIIEKEIEFMIKNYEPRVKVQGIVVSASTDTHEYDIRLDFFVVGVKEPQVYTTTLERLR